MGIAGRIRCGALGVALATTSLLACTPDGIQQPAPVYMMGSSTQPSRPAAAIAAPRPTFHPERRQASAAPASAAMAPIEHSKRPSIKAANNPDATPNAHSPIGTRQTVASKKRSRTYPVAGSEAGPIARTGMIPLDDIAAPAPAARVMPPAAATPSDPTTSTWVSPKPADSPQVEFRPPSPSGS
jgi:hypothetical protein